MAGTYAITHRHGQNTKPLFPRHFLKCEKGSNNAQYNVFGNYYYCYHYFFHVIIFRRNA